MANITIVTSFFDIGREHSSIEGMERNNQAYLNYFRFWARIKNYLIVYTQSDLKNEVLRIREEFGLLEQTKVVVLDDIYSILPSFYERMLEIEKTQGFVNFRYYGDAMSNQAKYCYLVLLQYWFIQDAVLNGWVDDYVGWIDFGFNHGDKYYTNEKDFDYLWDYEFDRRINCFALYDPGKVVSIDSLQFQKDCFMGGVLVLPKEYASKLWKYISDAEKALFMLDCMDDDQQLLLMAYRLYPEDFSIRICNWFEPLKICGGEHLTTKTLSKPIKHNLIWKIKRIISSLYMGAKYLLGKTEKSCFIKNSKLRCEHIYGNCREE